MSDWLISTPLIMGADGGEEQGEGGNQNELDLLKMDPNLLTFEQQIRRAELESIREMRQQQMQQEQQQQRQQQPQTEEITIEGVSQERLNQIINKGPDEMTEEEILI